MTDSMQGAKILWRYIMIPALALLLTMWIYQNFMKGMDKLGVATISGKASIGGLFELVNQDGEIIKASDYLDKNLLVYFGFSHCPAMCPTDLAVMTAALESLDEAELAQIQPIFISVDPERDSPQRLKLYSESFHPKIQFLTGLPEDIDKVTKAYKVYSQKVDDISMSDYQINHSGYMYLMGKRGKYLTHFNHGQSAEELIIGIRKYL